jgi:hypothetical protein
MHLMQDLCLQPELSLRLPLGSDVTPAIGSKKGDKLIRSNISSIVTVIRKPGSLQLPELG